MLSRWSILIEEKENFIETFIKNISLISFVIMLVKLWIKNPQ